MNRDPVAPFQAGRVAQQCGKLIDPDIEFLVGDMVNSFLFQLGNEMDRGLVLILGQVPVNAVVAGVDFAAFKPFKARCVTRIEYFIPIFIPSQQFGEFSVIVGEILQFETFENSWIGEVGLTDETCRWMIIVFFLPMNRNFSFRSFDEIFLTHENHSLFNGLFI